MPSSTALSSCQRRIEPAGSAVFVSAVFAKVIKRAQRAQMTVFNYVKENLVVVGIVKLLGPIIE